MGPGSWIMGRGGVIDENGSDIAMERRRFYANQAAYRLFTEEPPLTVEYPELQSALRWDQKSR
jgi:hypothetical protein